MAIVVTRQPGPPRKRHCSKREPTPHDRLVARAARWLRGTARCSIVITELVAVTDTGEIPDAIGWSQGCSILVECKASRADFLRDRHKPFRLRPESGMGLWRFILCPPEVVRVDDLDPGWGLLYAMPRIVRSVHGVPRGNIWGRPPFQGRTHYHSEIRLLCSALRRSGAA